MDIPGLVRQELGDEDILAGVSIGDEDVVCLTPTRTIIYRSEGLISDESVDSYPHEADRLKLSEGRRKSKFHVDYFDETRSFSVPTDYTRDVLTLLLEGILGADEVIDGDESIVGAFRFSEMTLIVAEKRLVRHIGGTVWADDYESYPYQNVTDIAFEEGSVATELVVSIDGRPQRIKIPRDDARLVEETVKTAVFGFYDVASFEELRRVVGVDEEAAEIEESTGNDQNDLTLGSGIEPLVTEDEDEDDGLIDTDIGATVETGETTETNATGTTETTATATDVPEKTAVSTTGTDDETNGDAQQTRDISTPSNPMPETEALETVLEDADVAAGEDLRALREQVGELSTAVKRQNQLLKKQHNAIKQLVEELREQ
ncbi:DUF7115 domain-containing protein [Halorhabdus rudnickae]|uniref:DUF7115 domain-containing protein n=1 Tax=Halorhabdus rudnickae TaxID=1775544 RepID=UPI0010844DF7|nr:hypothetical protein [Halorhabdus rudnickae]